MNWLLRLFSDVRKGESTNILIMLVNLTILLVGYYILKTAREPMILAGGGAEMKSYAAAAQALVLMGFIPLYSWFSSRVDRMKLIAGLTGFFVVCLELFYIGIRMKLPFLGFIFYVWLGVYNLAIVAQFWGFANDIYKQEAGERLFPVIAIGATAGSPIGSKVAGWLFQSGIPIETMLQIPAVILVIHLALLWVINRREQRATAGVEAKPKDEPLSGAGGFTLVLRSPYIRWIAILLILANLVNTVGEYVLSKTALKAAAAAVAADPSVDKKAFIGAYFADFFFYVNIITLLIQALLVSRIVKYSGMLGVLFALPIIATGAYGLIAVGVGVAAIRWLKTAENSTDYSVMNTAKAMLWLPTSRDEKYKAKQAVDTFFVRLGDVMAAGVVFVGTAWLSLSVTGFALINLAVIALWFGVGWVLLRHYNRLKKATDDEEAAGV